MPLEFAVVEAQAHANDLTGKAAIERMFPGACGSPEAGSATDRANLAETGARSHRRNLGVGFAPLRQCRDGLYGA
jgi:hypothetical protein